MSRTLRCAGLLAAAGTMAASLALGAPAPGAHGYPRVPTPVGGGLMGDRPGEGGGAFHPEPSPQTKTVLLGITGMTWPVECPAKVEAALVRVEGFKAVQVDFDRQQAKVTYDPGKTSPQKLAAAIEKETEFKVTVKK